jgi:hypothetical protein
MVCHITNIVNDTIDYYQSAVIASDSEAIQLFLDCRVGLMASSQ